MSAAEAAASVTTLGGTIQRGTPGRGRLRPAGTTGRRVPRGAHRPRCRRARRGRATRRTGLLAFVQLSDVHVVDHQSPARVEWADRYDDRDVSTDPVPGLFAGAHRPQELLTAQVADAMVRAINAGRCSARSPASRCRSPCRPVTTPTTRSSTRPAGTSTSSTVGPVRPDSGDLTRYEGVMDGDPAYYDTHYWHPEGTPAGKPDDLARSRYGFPVVTGLTTAARRRFHGRRARPALVHRVRQPRPARAGQLPAHPRAVRDRDRQPEGDLAAAGCLGGRPAPRPPHRGPVGAAAGARRLAVHEGGHARPRPSHALARRGDRRALPYDGHPGRPRLTGLRTARAGWRTTPSTRGRCGSSSSTRSTRTAGTTGRSTGPSSPGSAAFSSAHATGSWSWPATTPSTR